MKMKRKILTFIIPLLLLGVFICSANARGGVFVIQPQQEAVETLPSLNTAESVAGNFSADGVIDFYILGSNGTVLQYYNKTDFAEFKVYPDVEGVCTLHMANNYESRNVTVNLQYGINFVVVLTGNVGLNFQMPSPSITITPEPSFDWSRIVDFFKNFGSFIITALLSLASKIRGFIEWIRNWRYRRWWNKKYRKPRTPSTVWDSSSQTPVSH
jgi:hypothetical protein